MYVPESLEPIVLASASPQRRRILERLGLDFEICPSHIDESGSGELDGLEPVHLAERLAISKARSVAKLRKEGTVIGADTVVTVGNIVLGKPRSREDAHRILTSLSGKVQEVVTGLCLFHVKPDIMLSGAEKTRVITKPMSKKDIDDYIATGECFGKAGAYAIQETGDRFVERLEGSFDNVVGFPTELFIRFFEELAGRIKKSLNSGN